MPSEPTLSQRVTRAIIWTMAFLGLGITLLVLFGEGGRLWTLVRQTPPAILVFPLVMAMGNYLLRFVRWEVYLRTINVRIPLTESFLIFFSGLGMSLSPGKLGETIKAFFLKDRHGVPLSSTFPLMLAERINDVLGVFLLLVMGLFLHRGELVGSLLGAVLFVLAVWLSGSKRGIAKGLNLLFRLPYLRNRQAMKENLAVGLGIFCRRKLTLWVLPLSALAWLLEGVALWALVAPYAPSVGLFWSLWAYAAATLAGAISMIPGGLLATEASLTGLITTVGVDGGTALSITLVIRAATLWFAVILGMAALALLFLFPRKRHSKIEPATKVTK